MLGRSTTRWPQLTVLTAEKGQPFGAVPDWPAQAEIAATHIIVTTPEKWDVVTRKSTGDVGLAQQVGRRDGPDPLCRRDG